MVAHRGRHIDVGVGVMQCVETPEKRHRVLTAMYGVVQKIEQQKGRPKAQPGVGNRPGGQGYAECCCKLWPKGVRRREDEGGEDNPDKPEPDIAEPAPQGRKLSPPPRLA